MRAEEASTPATSAASESATWVGRGVGGSACARVVAPVSTSAESMPGAARAGHVDVQPVADGQHAARAEPVARGLVHRRLRLADDVRRPCGRWPSRSPRARRRCRATGRRASGTCASRVAPISSAPRSTACAAILSSSKSKPSWPPTTTTSARGGERRAVDDPQAGLGDVVDQRLRADDVRRAAAAALGQRGTARAAPTLSTSSSDAWKPSRHSLRTNSSGAWRTSLVRNRTDLPASRSAVDGVRRARAGVVADPQAAVEVEQDVVVGTDGGGERHAARIILAAPCHDSVAVLIASPRLAACSPRLRPGDATSRAPPREATPPSRRRRSPNGCEQVEQPAPKDVGTIKKPTEKLDPSKTYVATVDDHCGDFEITLDAKQRADHGRLVQVPGRPEASSTA